MTQHKALYSGVFILQGIDVVSVKEHETNGMHAPDAHPEKLTVRIILFDIRGERCFCLRFFQYEGSFNISLLKGTKMKLNKIMLAVSVVMGMSSFAHAADQGHGTVSFHGFIIDAPCSIDPDSVDQKIELGEISNVALENAGTSTPKPFQILLKNCSTATLKTVTSTFTGAEGVDGKLGITGSAAGAGIVLTNGDGTKITLGEPTKAQTIQDGDNTLSFAAYVQGDGASVTPGEFNGITDFTLAYQ